MDVESNEHPSQNYKKKSNKRGAMGTRSIGEGDTMAAGPTYIITVPETYTQDEMEEIVDLVMCAPDHAVGTAIAVREGVCFTKIDDGLQVHTKGCRCQDKKVDEDWD
jgi:hypothetical protein